MMRILVTGGTGYIGSHTVVELQQKGYEVTIVDNLSNSLIQVLSSIEKITGKKPSFEKVDLSDMFQTRAFFNKHEYFDAVIHFAAFKSVNESIAFPLKYFHNNIFALVNLIECCRIKAINNFVFSSSCTVYGQPDHLPVKEDTPFKEAASPYGSTKQISEQILDETSKYTPIDSLILRYFNPIGAHDSALIGEYPLEEPNNLIPYLMQTAIGKRACLKVFGNNYNTPDGTPIRDYIHVVDLAKAHVKAVDRMLQCRMKTKKEIYNLGTGKGYSVLDVIHAFEKVSKQKLNYEMVERRLGDIEKVWADTTLANKKLDWKAERSLDDMVLSAWKWEKYLANKK